MTQGGIKPAAVLCGVTLGDQRDDFAFARGQWAALTALAACGSARAFQAGGERTHHRCRGVRIQPDLAGVDLADALDDEVRRGLFQHDAATAQLHGLHELVLVLRGRQNDHARPLVGLLKRLQRRQAVQIGHAQIQQQNIGVQFPHALQHLAAVPGLSHDVEIILKKEQLLESIAHDGMIVGDEDANHRFLLFARLGNAVGRARGVLPKISIDRRCHKTHRLLFAMKEDSQFQYHFIYRPDSRRF